MKRRVMTLGASVVAILAALATVVPAFAFPTQSWAYPTYSTCSGVTWAYAFYGGPGEVIDVSTGPSNENCTSTAAKACLMTNDYNLICTGWDVDSNVSYGELSTADYYYGYGLGQVFIGFSGSGPVSTLSVAP